MANIREIYGNIFNTSCQTIVNTVNCVGIMGKGIALEFKYRFPDMYKQYVTLCKKKKLKPGELFLWKKSIPWVLNFPTKYHWKYPSKVEYIELGLKKFSKIYIREQITSIAFPILGTGNGGLKEKDILSLMIKYIEPLPNIEVEIYHYKPGEGDKLFNKLYNVIWRFQLEDYKKYIELSTTQAKIIIEAIKKGNVHNMMELKEVRGVGEKTIEKIYNFVNNIPKRIETYNEIYPNLFDLK